MFLCRPPLPRPRQKAQLRRNNLQRRIPHLRSPQIKTPRPKPEIHRPQHRIAMRPLHLFRLM